MLLSYNYIIHEQGFVQKKSIAIDLYSSSPLPSLGKVHLFLVFEGRRLVYNSVGNAPGLLCEYRIEG